MFFKSDFIVLIFARDFHFSLVNRNYIRSYFSIFEIVFNSSPVT